LVLDDYYAGVSANMELMGMNTDLGFIKVAEGNRFEYNDTQAAYATISGEAPINWGATLMFGQNHGNRTADIWLMPYAEVLAGPANLDLTLVINNQMFKDAAGDDDSEMGIGFALKAGIDVGFKLGMDLLYVTEDGINSYSSYYDNGLILFGNKDAFQGTQIMPAPYDWGTGENCMAFAVSASMPLSETMEVYANAGMVTIDDPIGTELNFGMNYKIAKGLMFCPVLAVGQSGKAIDSDENMVYMLGGLLKAEF
jgi:hypothetical protein